MGRSSTFAISVVSGLLVASGLFIGCLPAVDRKLGSERSDASRRSTMAGSSEEEPGENALGEGDPSTEAPRPTRDSGVEVPGAEARDGGAEHNEQSEDNDPSDDDAGTFDAGTDPSMDPPPQTRECYEEPLDLTISLNDLSSNFNANDGFDDLLEAMRRRWPSGHALVMEQLSVDPGSIGSCQNGPTFGEAMTCALAEVHDAALGWYNAHSLPNQHFDYWIRADLQHSLPFAIDGFPISEIDSMLEDDSTNVYRNVYLVGEEGARGFGELLNETNAYICGLGAMTSIADEVPFGISGRDGAVAFLYYVELYLRRARTTDPALYATMQNDAALKEHIKTQWLRTHFYLATADLFPLLGISDGDIRQRLYASANMAEINMFIGRCVDASPCLCD